MHRPSSAGEARRFGGLDSLRGLAAVGVVLVHTWMFAWGDEGRPPRETWELALGELRLGLPYFFVLSGFLLIGPYVAAALGDRPRPRLGAYAIRRLARVAPAYLVAVVGAIVLLHGTGNRLMPPADELWRYFAFVHNQDADTVGKLNPPLWSLGVEVMFYVALPVAGLALMRLRSRGSLIAGLLAVAAAALGANALLADQAVTWQMSLAGWFGYFALGGAAAVCVHDRRPRAAPLLAAGWALVVANGLWHVSGESHAELVLRDLPAGAGFALVVAGIASGGSRVLDLAPLRGLGVVSYGLYVWHFPVIVWLRLNDHWPEHLSVAVVYVLVLSLGMAALSWFAVERPAINLARRATARGRSPRPESPPRPQSEPRRSRPGARPAEGQA